MRFRSPVCGLQSFWWQLKIINLGEDGVEEVAAVVVGDASGEGEDARGGSAIGRVGGCGVPWRAIGSCAILGGIVILAGVVANSDSERVKVKIEFAAGEHFPGKAVKIGDAGVDGSGVVCGDVAGEHAVGADGAVGEVEENFDVVAQAAVVDFVEVGKQRMELTLEKSAALPLSRKMVPESE